MHRLVSPIVSILLAALSLGWIAPASAQTAATLDPKWVDAFQWRSIGPATMGGRIVAFSVYEADPRVWWAATASGGLLKTTNDGMTFDHQFDHENTVSIKIAPATM